MPKTPRVHEVVIDKLVHGGQGLGTLVDGKKALVWNVLPGEHVRFTERKSKSSFVEGVAEEILKLSSERETPRDDLYLSTSPWQMMTYASENKYKQEILIETLARGGVTYEGDLNFQHPEEQWQYRNKMEYSFWGDDNGLHLALYNRGTHQKQIVTGSSIARPEIDATANAICEILQNYNVRAGDLKSLIIRCNQAGECVAALFTRNEKFTNFLEFTNVCKGVVVYFSNPRSPASVATTKLYEHGDITLTDEILCKAITYDVLSFFQVNLDSYNLALRTIARAVEGERVTDMYAGTGSIGLSVGAHTLVEIDPHSAAMARHNAPDGVQIIETASEKATEYIPTNETVIFDPPRAGLHADVTAAVLEQKPSRIVYLSCNPSTFARDLALLQDNYEIAAVTGYNFFPRTPHIEALAILERR